ncbi:uncharacterized protein CBL_00832 [Carabus blaptoides fortunei]
MEKKQNRSVQPPAKGGGTESKKNQDVTSGKFWPRGGRRREPVGGSFTSKNEPNRKPIPQRNKSLDKRPKPRGGYYSEAAGGKEDTGVEQFDAELGSVFVPGSKKQSLNHLLNFHYTPRGDQYGSGLSAHRNVTGPHRWLSTQKHKYNKEQYLQANCQFVVNDVGDYKLYMNNPDALVNWDLVEQIHVQVSEFPSCPICLYPPVAAKMTRCGHVYCWSCVLHYLTLSDKTWRKCPICYESVHKSDLKSVIAMPHAAFNVGEYITFRLMRRTQGSLTAVPVNEAKISRNILLNMSETKVNTVYSKLLLANPVEVMSIIDRERNELIAQLREDENCPEKCFIEQAITQLDDREKVVLQNIEKYAYSVPKTECVNMNNEISRAKVVDENCHPTTNSSLGNDRSRFESVSSEGLGSEDFNTNIAVEDSDCASNATSTNDNTDNNIKQYYFYQAADGQHIYLHVLNTRMLEYKYGSLESCPETLHGRILEKEGGSMTEELRRRLRYLQHLPVTCQFEIAEIQLRPPVINKETLDNFHDQIETRRKRRQRRAKDEKRREKRINDEENRRMGRLPEVNMHIESLHQFPEFGGEDPPVGAGSSTDAQSFIPLIDRSSSPSLAGSVSMEEHYAGPSFAKMLTTGKSKPTSWPGLRSPSQTEQPARLINVTGSQSKTPQVRNNNQSDSEPDPDEYVPAPAYSQSFSDAIALALEKASISEKDSTAGPCSGGKKKKKQKQKVLFATSMAYSGK